MAADEIDFVLHAVKLAETVCLTTARTVAMKPPSGLIAVARLTPRHFAQGLLFARAPGRGRLAMCHAPGTPNSAVAVGGEKTRACNNVSRPHRHPLAGR